MKDIRRMKGYLASCVTREYAKLKKVWLAKRHGNPIPYCQDEYRDGEVHHYTDDHLLLWRRILPFPMGITAVDSLIFVCTDNFITVLDKRTGSTVEELRHHLFNDLHSIVFTGSDFLVTSSGADRVLRVNQSGKVTWEWSAVENGFTLTPLGHKKVEHDRWDDKIVSTKD